MIAMQLPQASTLAASVDRLYDIIFWISLFCFVAIVFGKLAFLIHFRRKKRPESQTPYITGHTPTEVGVSLVLLVLVMIIFYWGYVDYIKIRHAPQGAMEINVIAKQWLWEFEYPDGQKMTNEFYVPKGKPVKLIMTSSDVLHSFFVPNFRVKQDVIPGTYTSLWFEATETGTHQVFCAEYCGAAHSQMLAKVHVLEPTEFEKWKLKWLIGQAEAAPNAEIAVPPAEHGKQLFSQKGCAACHGFEVPTGIAPLLKGLYGKEDELTDGRKVKIDENYIRESLMEPTTKVVKGFQPIMPTFKGQLTDEEVAALIAYIRSLAEGVSP